MIYRNCILCFLSIISLVNAQQAKLGDIPDGSRSTPVHFINIYDETGSMIRLDDHPIMPFSTKQTCLPCHDYDKIKKGWHFNYAEDSVDAGRPGEPWILTDPLTGSQIPVAYRNWPGTFRPEKIGLNNWDFVQKFGRHLPGGGVGENEALDPPELFFRRQVSGALEINCLACHSADPAQDQAEYALQVQRQNFRWAAAGASVLATVHGVAKDMPDNYDIYYGVDPDNPRSIPPSVEYNWSQFNSKGKVFFNLTRRIPNQRCYFCHSSRIMNRSGHDEVDVHLRAGMLCVDCHQNGLDHKIVRGYENENSETQQQKTNTHTCAGCHLGNTSENNGLPGPPSAPVPEHKGIPLVHFEKLSCTACHSGPWPTKITGAVKTARAHALGTHGISKSADAVPGLQTPVFRKLASGKLAPHTVFWPSYWAFDEGDSLAPILPENVAPVIQHFMAKDTLTDSTNFARVRAGLWPEITDTLLIQVLDSLNARKDSATTVVYIGAGKLFRSDESGNLVKQEHVQAEPVSWPIAHDVRPAAQSLGIHGCDDCHSLSAPLYFGKVAVKSALVSENDQEISMTRFNGLGSIYPRIFALSFLFRPWLKFVIIFSCAMIALVLVFYCLKGIDTVNQIVANREELK